MSILKNVELYWCKLGKKLDTGFDGNSPAWSVNAQTRNKKQAEEWKKEGMNVKVKDDDDGMFWYVTLRKPVQTKDGRELPPPPVVGKDRMPFADVDTIGNGSIANVKVNSFEYDYKGRVGTSFRLDAIQILEYVEYAGSRSPVDYFDDET